jgi:hypothetical protein
MIELRPTTSWELPQVPAPNVADLEATVTAAEALAYQAKVYVAVTHAIRAQAYAEEVRQAYVGLDEHAEASLRSDWQGTQAQGVLSYRAECLGQLARRARRELRLYQQKCCRLAANPQGSV